jgi:flagellar biosynthesis protein
MNEKKKLKKAVALTYRAGEDKAPKVTASGRGKIAERIIETAREHGIPVKDDPDLVEVLSKLDIQEEIPPNVYVVVAELLAFAYSVNGKKAPA